MFTAGRVRVYRLLYTRPAVCITPVKMCGPAIFILANLTPLHNIKKNHNLTIRMNDANFSFKLTLLNPSINVNILRRIIKSL